MATTTVTVPHLDNTVGTLYIGVVVASALWGIGVAQYYWYYITYTNDSLRLKIFVFTTLIWDTVHQALISHLIYFFLVQNYFNPAKLDYHVWSLVFQSLFEALTCAFVQGFFVYRIYILSRSNYKLVILPALLVVAKFALSMVYVGKAWHIKSITVALVKVHPISAAMNGLAAAGDIVIAVTMAALLYSARSGLAKTDRMVMRLMTYAVNTGIITSLAAIVTLVLALALPGSPIYGAFYFLTGKLYLNTMLGSLNARNSITRGAMTVTGTTTGARFQKKVETVTTRDDEMTVGPFESAPPPKSGESSDEEEEV